ncbi:MAG: hypothetical protein ACRDMK_07815 [Gaiellaceae bacterium]
MVPLVREPTAKDSADGEGLGKFEALVEVKVIGWLAVPTAESEPFTVNVRRAALPCTTTPASASR